MSFAETCKILINTESAFKENVPHILTTAIGSYSQGLAGAVEFNYEDVYNREDKYSDVVGFFHTHPSGLDRMSATDIETMTQWVRCLGKSLICIIDSGDKISGWLFMKDDSGNVTHRTAQILSENDVNYDVWLDRKGPFWNPVDFLLEDPFEEMYEEDRIIGDMDNKLNDVLDGLGHITFILEDAFDVQD